MRYRFHSYAGDEVEPSTLAVHLPVKFKSQTHRLPEIQSFSPLQVPGSIRIVCVVECSCSSRINARRVMRKKLVPRIVIVLVVLNSWVVVVLRLVRARNFVSSISDVISISVVASS